MSKSGEYKWAEWLTIFMGILGVAWLFSLVWTAQIEWNKCLSWQAIDFCQAKNMTFSHTIDTNGAACYDSNNQIWRYELHYTACKEV